MNSYTHTNVYKYICTNTPQVTSRCSRISSSMTQPTLYMYIYIYTPHYIYAYIHIYMPAHTLININIQIHTYLKI